MVKARFEVLGATGIGWYDGATKEGARTGAAAGWAGRGRGSSRPAPHAGRAVPHPGLGLGCMA